MPKRKTTKKPIQPTQRKKSFAKDFHRDKELSKVDPYHFHDHDEENPEKTNVFDLTKLYLKEIGYTPLLNPEEEIKYGRLVQKGDQKARKIMIVSNLRLVVNIARHYFSRGLDFPDLMQEGNLGLLRAVEKFDPERGFRFSTYASWWIRQTIERAIMNQTRTIRLPIHVVRELNGYLITANNLLNNQFKEPSHGEIAAAHGVSINDVQELLELHERPFSLDWQTLTDAPNGKTLLDIMPDKEVPHPTEILENERMLSSLEQCLSALTEREREILCRRFGLAGYERQSLEEVGKAIGLTRERVRQIQIEGLKLLRRMMRKKGISGDE